MKITFIESCSPNIFGALFYGPLYLGKMPKGGGDEGLAKRFRLLLKVLYCGIQFKQFLIWAKCPSGRRGLGVPKILEYFSWTFDHFRLFKSGDANQSVQYLTLFGPADMLALFSSCIFNVCSMYSLVFPLYSPCIFPVFFMHFHVLPPWIPTGSANMLQWIGQGPDTLMVADQLFQT